VRLRRAVRTVAGITVILTVWGAYSAVDAQTPGWPLFAVTAVALVILITIALLKRRTFGAH
jgi:hypothetical protein